MNSHQDNVTSILYAMLEELSNYKRDRKSVLNDAVKERLNETFKVYYDSVIKAYDRLRVEDDFSLMKKLNRV